MSNKLSILTIRDAILEFLQDRQDVVIFGALAINTYLPEHQRETDDVDMLSNNASCVAQDIFNYLTNKFQILIFIHAIHEGRIFRLYQISSTGSRQLADVTQTPQLPRAQVSNRLQMIAPDVLMAIKVNSYNQRREHPKAKVDWLDALRMLKAYPEFRQQEGSVKNYLKEMLVPPEVYDLWDMALELREDPEEGLIPKHYLPIRETILEFLKGRDDIVLFGGVAVNIYVKQEQRQTLDVDVLSVNTSQFIQEIHDHLLERFRVTLIIKPIYDGSIYHLYQVKPNLTHYLLVDAMQTDELPKAQIIDGIQVMNPDALIATKLYSYYRHYTKMKGLRHKQDLYRLLQTYPELKIKNGAVQNCLQTMALPDNISPYWQKLVDMDDEQALEKLFATI